MLVSGARFFCAQSFSDSMCVCVCVCVCRCAGASSRADFERQYGARIWRAAPKAYDFLTKIEVLSLLALIVQKYKC